MSPTPQERLLQARHSLLGLSIGDALGKRLFLDLAFRAERRLPASPWTFTDDTRMASAIVTNLQEHHHIHQDQLAVAFAADFMAQPERGYGAVAHFILHQMAQGTPWQQATTSVYGGEGSKGNGGAMRAGPVGAFFFDDLDHCAHQARLSAQVTHAHPDGQAGAIAAALTAAVITQAKRAALAVELDDAWKQIIARTPEGETREGLKRAQALGTAAPAVAAAELGSGIGVLSSDTTPFALWFALHHHHQGFESALWTLFGALPSPDSDNDTIAAIVGSIVALADPDSIPEFWFQAVEKTPHTAHI